MTETELQRLKSLSVPAPAEGARATAVAAALAAYDAAASAESPSGSAAGSATVVSFRPRPREWRRSPLIALAASLALAIVSVPLAIRYLNTDERPARLAAHAPQSAIVAAKTSGPAADGRLAERSAPAPAPAVAPAPAATEVAPQQPVTTVAPPAAVVAGTGTTSAEARKRADAAPAPEEAIAARPVPPPAPPAALPPPAQVAGVADSVAPKAAARAKTAPGRSEAARPGGVDANRPVPGLIIGQLPAAGSSANRSVLLPPSDGPAQPKAIEGKDQFQAIDANPIRRVAEHPVSTFSIDVDTASYSWVRRQLNAGRLPSPDAVRVEEMVNYFSYDYPRPESREVPFQPTVTVVPSPWSPGNKLVHVAIKGFAITPSERPRANLVLLVDTSGSMAGPDRLPLLRSAFRMLVETLAPDDTVAIVTYAGNAAVSLEPTRIAERGRVLAAIDGLVAGGSTAGAAGLQRAYALAEAGFDPKAVNRIILGTDGDFNVGIVDRRELKAFIERKRATGVYLSILGVGMGNHNDRLMQTLAQAGNGVAAYIDTLTEARRVLVEEASSTLFPIANDVKIQLEFNPAEIAEWRLIGYETRALRREDFANDAVDAGDIGSGHAVTAIYEITPAGGATAMAPLRYAVPAAPAAVPAAPGAQGSASLAPGSSAAPTAGRELGFLRLRYKRPGEPTSRLIEIAIRRDQALDRLEAASGEVRFAIAVAAFGQLLKGLPYLRAFGFDDVHALAAGSRGEDPFGYRSEFLSLVRLAKSARP